MFLSHSSSLPEGWRCGAEVSAGVKVSVDAFGLSLIPELLLKCASQCVGRLHHQCYAKGRGRASFDNTCKHLRHRRESAHKPDMACTGIVTWGASLAGSLAYGDIELWQNPLASGNARAAGDEVPPRSGEGRRSSCLDRPAPGRKVYPRSLLRVISGRHWCRRRVCPHQRPGRAMFLG